MMSVAQPPFAQVVLFLPAGSCRFDAPIEVPDEISARVNPHEWDVMLACLQQIAGRVAPCNHDAIAQQLKNYAHDINAHLAEHDMHASGDSVSDMGAVVGWFFQISVLKPGETRRRLSRGISTVQVRESPVPLLPFGVSN